MCYSLLTSVLVPTVSADLKRSIAYTTLQHVQILLCLTVLDTQLLMVYIVVHSLYKAFTFVMSSSFYT